MPRERVPPPAQPRTQPRALVDRRLSLLFFICVLCTAHAAPKEAPLTELNNQRLLIDVDPGSDDAMALLFILGAEKYGASKGATEVPKTEAITLVNGNTNMENAVINVFRVLDAAGRLDIPVYAGATDSLISTPASDNYFGEDGFGNIGGDRTTYDGKLQKEHAVNALIKKVTENPGELTLLCLGPLTNIALAERLHKGFVSKVRRLIVMGGSVEGVGNVKPAVEFNIYIDPESFQVVLDAAQEGGKPLLLVPWETVILRVKLSLEWRSTVLGAMNSPGIELLNRAEKRFLDKLNASSAEEQLWPAADVLAAAVVLDVGLVTRVSKPLNMGVAHHSGPGRAMCYVDYNNVTGRPPNARIVLDLDAQGIKKLLLEYVA